MKIHGATKDRSGNIEVYSTPKSLTCTNIPNVYPKIQLRMELRNSHGKPTLKVPLFAAVTFSV